jgi:hypothetical protein
MPTRPPERRRVAAPRGPWGMIARSTTGEVPLRDRREYLPDRDHLLWPLGSGVGLLS